MNIFVICPVRLGVPKEALDYVSKLESEGNKVHFPPRDTNQIDPLGGWNICNDNALAIAKSDEVHIFYRPDSQGIHFDLGMAFVLRKKIKLINVIEVETSYGELKKQNKSFLNLIEYWERQFSRVV